MNVYISGGKTKTQFLDTYAYGKVLSSFNIQLAVSQVAFVRCLMAISGTTGVGVSNLNVRALPAYVGHGSVVKP